jgi:FlaA1/EpsC-like NDP-sugar epimerase
MNKKKFFSKISPAWLIIVFDLTLALMSLALSYLIIFFDSQKTISILYTDFYNLKYQILVFTILKFLIFYFFKIHKGLLRYSSNDDFKRIFIALTTFTFALSLIGILRYYYFDSKFIFPRIIIVLEFLISLFLLGGCRVIVRRFFQNSIKSDLEFENIIIYGSGVLGLMTKNTIENAPRNNQKIIGFIDDNVKLKGVRISGVNVYSTTEFIKLCKTYTIKTLIIAIKNPIIYNQKKIVDFCIENSININKVPNPKSWINGEFSSKQITKIKIEDLLERDCILLEQDTIKKELDHKIILVTGAAGSIGRGISEQIASFNPKLLILLDQAESPLFDLQNNLINNFPELKFEIVIADISDEIRMNNLFNTFNPQIVFHAAAYKHVPMMEMNPSEAIKTNILGTKIISDLSHSFKLEKFVMISTDKAVNPTNVMGASKRIAEIYIENINKASQTNYVITRFGNVLGSNGSVIPIFQKQIENGGPITITDERITRYFMTIPEACQLVLEAGSMGKGGEIFIFDMGESIKIIDLAKKMIVLSGLELGRDINIKITGLRPGEKLYEELLAEKENTLPTYHSKILIAKNHDTSSEKVKDIEELITLIPLQDNQKIVKKMKEIVEEFKSNNSIYEVLD